MAATGDAHPDALSDHLEQPLGAAALDAVTNAHHLQVRVQQLENELAEARDATSRLQAALAKARQRAEDFETALQTSRDIGAAMGILMAQRRITRDDAFTLLKLASQDTHRKVRDIALDVVQTGALDTRSPNN